MPKTGKLVKCPNVNKVSGVDCRECRHRNPHREDVICRMGTGTLCGVKCEPCPGKGKASKPKSEKKSQLWMHPIPFDKEEMLILFEAAKKGLADAEFFDELCDHLDTADVWMLRIREKLNTYLEES